MLYIVVLYNEFGNNLEALETGYSGVEPGFHYNNGNDFFIFPFVILTFLIKFFVIYGIGYSVLKSGFVVMYGCFFSKELSFKLL